MQNNKDELVLKKMKMVAAISLGLCLQLSPAWAQPAKPSASADISDDDKPAPEKKKGFWERSFQPNQYFTNLKADAKRFNEMDALAKSTAATQANYVNYVQAGITLSDSACVGWLQTLAYSERDTNFFKDIFNIVGNLIMGIAGINGAASASLAKGSLGMAAGNATIEAYQNEVILGTISDIQSKLEEGRRTSAAYFLEHVPSNYDEAKRRLAEYHGSCTPGAVKTLLKTSLAAVKYVAPDTSLAGPIAAAKSDMLVSQVSEKIFPEGKGALLSDDVLYKLYVSQIMMPTSSAAFVAAMKTDRFVTLKATAVTAADVIPQMQRIADLRGYSAKAQLELKKELEAGAAHQVTVATNDVGNAGDASADAKETADKKKDAAAAVIAAVVTTTDPTTAAKLNSGEMGLTEVKQAAAALPVATPPAEVQKVKAAVAAAEKSALAAKAAADKLQEKKDLLNTAINHEATVKSSALEIRKATPGSISAVLVPNN